MFRKIIAIASIITICISTSFGQTGQGAIKGTVKDKETKEPLPFVNVIVELNGTQVTGAATDFDGNFMIKPLSPGTYDIKATFTGFQPIQITGIIVKSDKISYQDLGMAATAIDITEFEVIFYAVPLIDKDNTASGATITRDDIDKLPGRSATAVAQTVGGVFSKDDGGGDLNIRGSRDDANYFYIDGVKVRGSSSLPKAGIEQVSVITGGIPAQYGDVTGGIISITTRGASSEYAGGVDYQTSGYRFGDKMVGLDPYGYNLLEFNVTGPLLYRKDTSGAKTKPLLGFFLSGNGTSIVDGAPSSIGMWKLKDEKLKELNENPVTFDQDNSTVLNHSYLRLSDFEKTKTRQNVSSNGINLNGKLDVNTSSNTSLSFGGTVVLNKQNNDYYRSGDIGYTAMNWNNNPEIISNTWRAYSRFTHRFGSENQAGEEKSASLIKNAFYSIQADYQQSKTKIWDDTHKDNLFRYGYLGKFKTKTSDSYELKSDTATGLTGRFFSGKEDDVVAFEPNETLNPELAAFTKAYYSHFGYDFDKSTLDNPVYDEALADENFKTKANIVQARGLLNGSNPQNVYDIWQTSAQNYNSNSKSSATQFRINATGSADIKDHAISVGFEYEQRVDRGFSVSPVGLWNIMREKTGLVNKHISSLDLNNPKINWINNIATVDYDFLYIDTAQSFFDYNLREKLGLPTNGFDRLEPDSYDPDMFSLDMFSADELLNGGSSLVSYNGYDHTGKKISKDPSFDDFFTEKDEFGNFTRPIGAFRPIYIAGFIQDKFSFNDLVFNLGLRIDRFDANQQVLKDPYVMFETIKANEDDARALIGDKSHPGVIEQAPDKYVVYVDDVVNPSSVVGYRNIETNKWFSKDGSELENGRALGNGASIAPLLVNKKSSKGTDITSKAFEDYKPQTNFMPRISFSFPISDEAQFFAHYDVLTKRPTSGIRLNPLDYYFISTRTNQVINNPNLKAETTVDYEVGFTQKINNFSALTLSAFYRELKNQVQIISITEAFPQYTYRTYGNIDFGTIKGLNFSYDLRRFGNIRTRIAYTLQFADGTGSDATSALNLAQSNSQSIRTALPLSYDQRHSIVMNMDYRYSGGKDYNGPVLFEKQILAEAGANFVFQAGSGTPYSRQSDVTPEGLISGGRSNLQGSVNGSRLPWQFRIDAIFDKNFNVSVGKNDEGKKRTYQCNAYLQVLNLLNTQNVTRVYRATGNADDDGYLTAARWQQNISEATDEYALRELYAMRINTGANYALPRRIRLGIRFSF